MDTRGVEISSLNSITMSFSLDLGDAIWLRTRERGAHNLPPNLYSNVPRTVSSILDPLSDRGINETPKEKVEL